MNLLHHTYIHDTAYRTTAHLHPAVNLPPGLHQVSAPATSKRGKKRHASMLMGHLTPYSLDVLSQLRNTQKTAPTSPKHTS